MPTAQSTHVSSSAAGKVTDNKIAKAVAKVSKDSQREQSTENQQPQQSSTGSTGNKTPQDQPEFIKQSLILVEKKVRNLEKRRSKLDEYRALQKKGTALNEDQQQAVERYDEVTRTLELARELEKQFIALANDAMKQQKKQVKKEQLEREEAVKEKLRESQRILSLLSVFGDETVRNDFTNETNGAFRLSADELAQLDDFNKLVDGQELGARLDAACADSAEHMFNLIEAKNKPVQWGAEASSRPNVTYSELRKLFDRIFAASYWNKEQQQQQQQQQRQEEEQQQQQQQAVVAEVVEQQQQAPVSEQNVTSQLNNLQLNNEQTQQNVEEPVQGVFQQNTSDDYVLVNQNDVNEAYQQQQQQQQQQQSPNSQQQNQKTFFSTLNPTETRNINEFLSNRDDALNFLQDSELAAAHQAQQEFDLQQQQLQQQQSQEQHHHNNNQFRTNNYRGNRSGEYNNSNNGRSNQNREYQPRPRYQDQQQQQRDGQPRQNGPREQNPRNGGGGGYQGSKPSGGPQQGGNRNANYRGNGNGNFNNGPRNNGPSNQRQNYPQQQQYNQAPPTNVA